MAYPFAAQLNKHLVTPFGLGELSLDYHLCKTVAGRARHQADMLPILHMPPNLAPWYRVHTYHDILAGDQ